MENSAGSSNANAGSVADASSATAGSVGANPAASMGLTLPFASDTSDCRALRNESVQVTSDAVASAPVECTSDSDCMLYVRRPNCVYDCGLVAAVSDPTLIDAAIDRVDADLCPDQCQPNPVAPCGPVYPYRPTCQANRCWLDTYLAVMLETFRDTLYPLLRNECQDCHGAETRNQEPLLADPDVAKALGGVLPHTKWKAEAFGAAIQEPSNWRLVQMLSIQQHHCWTDCSANASEMTSAIQAWSDTLTE